MHTKYYLFKVTFGDNCSIYVTTHSDSFDNAKKLVGEELRKILIEYHRRVDWQRDYTNTIDTALQTLPRYQIRNIELVVSTDMCCFTNEGHLPAFIVELPEEKYKYYTATNVHPIQPQTRLKNELGNYIVNCSYEHSTDENGKIIWGYQISQVIGTKEDGSDLLAAPPIICNQFDIDRLFISVKK